MLPTLLCIILPTLILILKQKIVFGQSNNYTAFKERQLELINYGLSHPSLQSLVIEAKEGFPLNQTYLNDALEKLPTNRNADFDLIKLVRCLYYNISKMDEENILNSVRYLEPFWLKPNQTTYLYWTENHQIQWMSSAFLLNQKYNLTVDDNLYYRLINYLNLKINYGFYEWYSATYFPYSMSGLLNLAEFSDDILIQNLSMKALQKQLLYLLKAVNNKGTFFPVQARAHGTGKYTEPYHQNSVQIMYLLTGLGENTLNTNVYSGSAFLACTELDLSSVVYSYKPSVYEIVSFGNTLNEFRTLNLFKNLTFVDRVTFQMSAGCYANPGFIKDTLEFTFYYEVENNIGNQLKLLDYYNNISNESFVEFIEPMTTGSIITNMSIMLYKNGVSLMSSLVNYSYVGSLDYNMFPFCATTGTLTIFLVSGTGTKQNIMAYLPEVKQIENVALVKFDRTDIEIFALIEEYGFGMKNIKDVFLNYPVSKMDEMNVYNNWIIAREDNGYIGVRRDTDCLPQIINDTVSCDKVKQIYSFIVGNNEMYQNFNNFQNVIRNSTYNEDINKINIDGITIEMGPKWL